MKTDIQTDSDKAVGSSAWLGSLVEPKWNRLLWFLQWVQFWPTSLNAKHWANVRSAKNTIELCRELGIKPQVLFDVGANDGQWAYWLQKEYSIPVVSFEPNATIKPRGEFYCVALSDCNGSGSMAGEDTSGHLVAGNETAVWRFDELYAGTIPSGSILKIDAETHSARAMLGFGKRIREFDVIVIETGGTTLAVRAIQVRPQSSCGSCWTMDLRT
jgi:hypothetical protein